MCCWLDGLGETGVGLNQCTVTRKIFIRTCLDRHIERECSTVDSEITDIPDERDIIVVRLPLRQRLLGCMCIKWHNRCWKEGRKKRVDQFLRLLSIFKWRRSRLDADCCCAHSILLPHGIGFRYPIG